jgi:hypothetical protein
VVPGGFKLTSVVYAQRNAREEESTDKEEAGRRGARADSSEQKAALRDVSKAKVTENMFCYSIQYAPKLSLHFALFLCYAALYKRRHEEIASNACGKEIHRSLDTARAS